MIVFIVIEDARTESLLHHVGVDKYVYSNLDVARLKLNEMKTDAIKVCPEISDYRVMIDTEDCFSAINGKYSYTCNILARELA